MTRLSKLLKNLKNIFLVYLLLTGRMGGLLAAARSSEENSTSVKPSHPVDINFANNANDIYTASADLAAEFSELFNTDEEQQLIKQAESFERSRNWEEAAPAIEKLLRLNPNSAYAKKWMSLVVKEMNSAFDAENFDKAEKNLNIIIKLYPNDESLKTSKSLFFYTQQRKALNHKDYVEADKLTDKLLDVIPNSGEFFISKIVIKIAQIQHVEAHVWLKKLLDLYSKDVYVLENLNVDISKLTGDAALSATSQHSQHSIDYARKIISVLEYLFDQEDIFGVMKTIWQSNPEAMFAAAWAKYAEKKAENLIDAGNITTAIKYVNQLLTLKPNEKSYLECKIICDVGTGDHQSAIKNAEKLLEIDPKSEYALTLLTYEHLIKDDYKVYGLRLEEIEIQNPMHLEIRGLFRGRLALDPHSLNRPLLEDGINDLEKYLNLGQEFIGHRVAEINRALEGMKLRLKEFQEEEVIHDFTMLPDHYLISLNAASRKALYRESTVKPKISVLEEFARHGFGLIFKASSRSSAENVFERYMLVYKNDAYYTYRLTEESFLLRIEKYPENLDGDVFAVMSPKGLIIAVDEIKSHEDLIRDDSKATHFITRYKYPIMIFFLGFLAPFMGIAMINRFTDRLSREISPVPDTRVVPQQTRLLEEFLKQLNQLFADYISKPWYQVDENRVALDFDALLNKIAVAHKALSYAKDFVTLKSEILPLVWLNKLKSIFGRHNVKQEGQRFVISIDLEHTKSLAAVGDFITDLIHNSVEYSNNELIKKIDEIEMTKAKQIKDFVKFFQSQSSNLDNFSDDATSKRNNCNDDPSTKKFADQLIDAISDIKKRAEEDSLKNIANKEMKEIRGSEEVKLQHKLKHCELTQTNLQSEIGSIKEKISTLDAIKAKLKIAFEKSNTSVVTNRQVEFSRTSIKKENKKLKQQVQQPETFNLKKNTNDNSKLHSTSAKKEESPETPRSAASVPTLFGHQYELSRELYIKEQIEAANPNKAELPSFSKAEQAHLDSILHHVDMINTQGIKDLQPPVLCRSALATCLIELCEALKNYNEFLYKNSAGKSYIDGIEYVINLRNWLRHLFATVSHEHSITFLDNPFDSNLRKSLLSLETNQNPVKDVGLLILTGSALYINLKKQFDALCAERKSTSIKLNELGINYADFQIKVKEGLDRLISLMGPLEKQHKLEFFYIYERAACKREFDFLGKLYKALDNKDKELVKDNRALYDLLIECKKIKNKLGHVLDKQQEGALVEGIKSNEIFKILELARNYYDSEGRILNYQV